MNRHPFIRVLMEQAGTPTDAGNGGTPPAADPNPAPAQPAADPKPAPAPQEPAADPAEPKPTDAGKKTLLGGAKADEPPAPGSAEPKPNGGNDTGDGDQNPPTDPYAELKLPDGAAVDETSLTNYKKLAKELNLSSENAQRVLDFEAKRLADGAAKAAQDWQEQVKQTYGDKLPTVMATAARAVEKFGGDELRTLLDQTGLGNHPIMVKAFHDAGMLLQEDRGVSASGQPKRDLTFAEALYGTRSK